MKRVLLLSILMLHAAGCLPTRENHPFGEGGTDASANNGGADVEGNNSGGTDADGDNNDRVDAANNIVLPDLGGNNAIPDAGDNNVTPDLGDNNNTADMCVPESATELCERVSAECGALTETDNCGVERAIDCGTCSGGDLCENNVCGSCDPEDDVTFCARQGAECGALTSLDNCRTQRTVNCGGCGGPGLGCNLENTCQEIDCRDGVDNDGAAGADCADPACLGQLCSGNPNKVCRAGGACN